MFSRLQQIFIKLTKFNDDSVCSCSFVSDLIESINGLINGFNLSGNSPHEISAPANDDKVVMFRLV